MSIYSQDLREKVMAAVAQDKQSNRAIAETVGISESTIEKWTRRQRETGSVAAAPVLATPDIMQVRLEDRIPPEPELP